MAISKHLNTTDNEHMKRHIIDVERIKEVLHKNGYNSDLEDCYTLWNNYSDMLCAGWIGLPDSDEELWEILRWEI